MAHPCPYTAIGPNRDLCHFPFPVVGDQSAPRAYSNVSFVGVVVTIAVSVVVDLIPNCSNNTRHVAVPLNRCPR